MNIMKFVPVALPILGLIGFVNHIEWLFYIAGGLSALGTIPFALSRPFTLLGAGVVVCLIIGYNVTDAVVSGAILGSCIAGLFAIPMFLLVMLKK
ncbi:MAG: hypothetical protein IKU71_03920 [Kiritimatiellae bacterium]|nr:hypothetical protein [Kiritimatiellia bacterium]